MLVKFEQNHMVQTIQSIELFDKKIVNHFWQSVDAILEDVSVIEQVFDADPIIKRLSSVSVPKITVVRQV